MSSEKLTKSCQKTGCNAQGQSVTGLCADCFAKIVCGTSKKFTCGVTSGLDIMKAVKVVLVKAGQNPTRTFNDEDWHRQEEGNKFYKMILDYCNEFGAFVKWNEDILRKQYQIDLEEKEFQRKNSEQVKELKAKQNKEEEEFLSKINLFCKSSTEESTDISGQPDELKIKEEILALINSKTKKKDVKKVQEKCKKIKSKKVLEEIIFKMNQDTENSKFKIKQNEERIEFLSGQNLFYEEMIKELEDMSEERCILKKKEAIFERLASQGKKEDISKTNDGCKKNKSKKGYRCRKCVGVKKKRR